MAFSLPTGLNREQVGDVDDPPLGDSALRAATDSEVREAAAMCLRRRPLSRAHDVLNEVLMRWPVVEPTPLLQTAGSHPRTVEVGMVLCRPLDGISASAWRVMSVRFGVSATLSDCDHHDRHLPVALAAITHPDGGWILAADWSGETAQTVKTMSPAERADRIARSVQQPGHGAPRLSFRLVCEQMCAGPQTPEDVAAAQDLSAGTVLSVFSRYRGRVFERVGRGKWDFVPGVGDL